MGVTKKKILIAGSSLAGALVLALMAVPLLLGDQLQSIFLGEANERLETDVTVGDIGLGLLRTFPDLSVRVNDLVLTNRAPFEGRELLSIEELVIRLDLLSLLPGRTPRVKRIEVRNARADLVTTEDGTVNFLVVRPDSAASGEGATRTESGSETYRIALQEYSIEGLDLALENRRSGFGLEALGVRHGGAGTVTGGLIELDTRTEIESLTTGTGKAVFLSGVRAGGEADVSYDAATRTVRFRTETIALNEMGLEAEGSMTTRGDTVEMDVDFRAPAQDFKALLSLVPAFLEGDFQELETGGEVEVEGTIAGRSVVGSEDLPGFDIRAGVSGGRIRYPAAPSELTDVAFQLQATHPGDAPLDAVRVRISDARATLDQGGIEGSLAVATPLTDPEVNLDGRADLDLAKLAAVLPMDGTTMAGRLTGQVALAGRRSDFEARRVGATRAEGSVRLQDVVVERDDWGQNVRVPSLTGSVTPMRLDLSEMDVRVGASDLRGAGHLEDIVPHLLGDAELRGAFTLRSRFLDLTELQEWMRTAAGERAEGEEQESVVIPGDLALELDVAVDTLRYGRHEVTALDGRARIAAGALSFEEVTGNVMGGNLALDGSYATFADAPAQVDVGLQLAGVSFGRAFQEVGFMSRLAPILAQATGTFSTGISLTSELAPDLAPTLSTLDAAGTLRTAEVTLQSAATQRLASLLGNQALSTVGARNLLMRFGIEDGRLTVQPTEMRLGSFGATLSGSTGLDRSLDYRITTNLPVSGIQLPEALAATGLTSGTIPVEIRVGGSVSAPAFEPVFGSIASQAGEAVSGEVGARAAEQIRAAEVRGDSLVAEANREAERIRAEARATVERLRAEARARADDAVAQAAGNPIAEAAARTLANRILAEADRQAQSVIDEADERANAVVEAAEEARASLIEEARAASGGG
jgi:uncharacterized protein involved in outer membrane biogenesis